MMPELLLLIIIVNYICQNGIQQLFSVRINDVNQGHNKSETF